MAEIDEATWNASALTVPIAGVAAPMRLVLVAPLDNAAKLLDAARKVGCGARLSDADSHPP